MVADQIVVRFAKFKMADPIWRIILQKFYNLRFKKMLPYSTYNLK